MGVFVTYKTSEANAWKRFSNSRCNSLEMAILDKFVLHQFKMVFTLAISFRTLTVTMVLKVRDITCNSNLLNFR